MQNVFIFLIGAAGYGIIEIIWRGYTHWTMLMLGGMCLNIIIHINNNVAANFAVKCMMCSAAITAAEFVTGIIVNLILHWNIWDYGNMEYNLLGQICPFYSVLWFFLSASVMLVCNFAGI